MGNYFNPANDLAKKARSIPFSDDFYRAMDRLRPGERLVALLNNGVWRAAPFLPDESEFKAFYDGYASGRWLSMDLFALPADDSG